MTSAPYPVVGSPDFPEVERRVLARWKADDSFKSSIEMRPPDTEYVFYDGPPFANGLPHHGHLLSGYVKDVVPRYQTMRGHRVDRRFGWDCHGLPAEMEAERELGVSGRAAIVEYGIDRFNAYCRESVLRYTREWEETVTRQARWVDFENDYKTMDLPYMESVMWAFKQLHEKGLIYEAFRVMPYSWGAETPLSNFEIRLDDATRPRQDPAITVAFDLVPAEGDPGPMKVLAWTTTPWTLPSNLALAVGPDIDYAILEEDGTYYVIGAAVVDAYEAQLAGADSHGTVKGSELVGRHYRPLFPYFEDRKDAFRVLAADFVDTSEGTGVVHMAPGFGEEDQVTGEANGIPIGRVVPVDDQGRFTDDVIEWAGENVFDANPSIIRWLKTRDRIVRHDTYEHNYPHCWRTDTPIIYKAISSWYVEVTAIRDRLVELNQEINWVPDHVRDGRFGMWLEGARDWSISRNRFWGTPIPVWRSDDPDHPRVDVYGSLDQIEADFGVRPDDLHRPYIDELTRPNPDDPSGKSTMRRVPEVLDCWFESGSMPFAQVHYPFENAEWFAEHFPADFIVEYINQTRGWFYTLHVLAGALFDKPAFQNVICHGILAADDGAKLSKKLRNYTEPTEIFETQGSDAFRWYLMASNALRGGDLRVSDQGIDDVTRQVMLPIWNAYSFFTLYANVENHRARIRTDSSHVLDRYLLAKTRALIDVTTDRMDVYDLPGATSAIQGFIDALNNWYIRRSPRPLLGHRRLGGRRARVRHPLHRTDDLLPGRRPLPAHGDGRRSTAGSPVENRFTSPSGPIPTPRVCPTIRLWSPAWTGSATSPRPRCGSVRTPRFGSGCRWHRRRSPAPVPRTSLRSSTSSGTRSTSSRSSSPTPSRVTPPSCCVPTAPSSVRSSQGNVQAVFAAARSGDWQHGDDGASWSPATPSSPASSTCRCRRPTA